MPLTRARIGVLMGGRSAEREISLRTGQAVHRALLRRGYQAVAIDVDASVHQQLRTNKVQVVFLALHGPGGEDGTIQGFLEIIGMPYTGSGVRASAIAMHKVTTKTLLDCHGIPVPPGTVVQAGRPERGRRPFHLQACDGRLSSSRPHQGPRSGSRSSAGLPNGVRRSDWRTSMTGKRWWSPTSLDARSRCPSSGEPRGPEPSRRLRSWSRAGSTITRPST